MKYSELSSISKRVMMKEPYPRNLMLVLVERARGKLELPVENITKDMIVGTDYAISLLTEKEADIISLRYKEHKLLGEIAVKYGVTAERIRSIEGRAEWFLTKPENSGYIKYGKSAFEVIRAETEKQEMKRGYSEETLNTSIEAMDLTIRSCNCLLRVGYTTIRDLAYLTEEQVIKIPYLCLKQRKEVAEKLASFGVLQTAWDDWR